MRDNPTIAAHRTAARTGTTFDMADLLTNGTATKPPGMYLPKDHPAMQVIALNEFTMPGDALGVSPRHPPVTIPPKERMAQIIRERSLDLVNLMDDFLKRPAYSRMPTRNRAPRRANFPTCTLLRDGGPVDAASNDDSGVQAAM